MTLTCRILYILVESGKAAVLWAIAALVILAVVIAVKEMREG